MEWTVTRRWVADVTKDVHVAVALDALGAQIDSRGKIAATEAGATCSPAWLGAAHGPAGVLAVEGARVLGSRARPAAQGGRRMPCWECERPRRQERRRGKSDLIDAALAAQQSSEGGPQGVPRWRPA